MRFDGSGLASGVYLYRLEVHPLDFPLSGFRSERDSESGTAIGRNSESGTKELVSVLRNLKPDIQILEATMTVNVNGVVNVWCPQVQEYQANQEFFEKRKAAGDKV